ncbi:MAG: hypothetical protein ACYS0G_03445 [Planctomycetota bacterium]|jgi:hypothetical protein
MRIITWLLVAALGLGLMVWSYLGWQRIDADAPWATGLLVLGDAQAPTAPEEPGFEHFEARVRLLETSGFAQAMADGMAAADEATRRAVRTRLSEKLILVSPKDMGIGDDALASGRMPVAGRGEVIAGSQALHRDRLSVNERELAVVGVLRRDVALFANSYLLPPDESLEELFSPQEPSVWAARLIRIKPAEGRQREVHERLREAYPPTQFASDYPRLRVERGPYYLYLAGQALLLLGGSGTLIGLYVVLARRRIAWLGQPLAELANRRRLLWAVHLAYFGLVVLASLVVYELPALQVVLLGAVESQIADEGSVLGVAGKAYGSRIIPLAAAATLVINFLLGTILSITLPSVVIPGSGALMAGFRATLWGLLLAPTMLALSPAMIPHSVTLLLEGEAYVLATFFAVLIPIFMCQQSLGRGVWPRYGRAVLLNLKASLLIAVVLLVAACYEAVEVILMMG